MNIRKICYRSFTITNFWLIALITVIFSAVVVTSCPIRYEDNDDITSAWIASGTYSGTPDGHLIFINALYGFLVAGLYSMCSSIEWYTILYIAFLTLSCAIIIWFTVKKVQNRYVFYIAISLAYTFLFYFLLNLQFTTVAAALAFSGVLLLIDRHFVYGGFLLLVASLIRFPAAGLVGLMMMPALVNSYKLEWKHCYLPLAFVLFIVLGCHYADKLFYQTPELKTFMLRTENMCAGAIQDNPNCWRVRMNLPDGVSTTNFDMIAGFCADPEVVTPEMAIVIHESLKKIPLLKKVKNIYRNFLPKYDVWLIGIFIVLIIANLKQKKEHTIIAAIVYAIWVGILCFISLDATVKFRVFLCTLIPMMYYIIVSLTETNQKIWCILTSCGIILGLMIWGMLIPALNRIQIAPKNQEILKEQMALYNQAGELKVVTDGADLRVEYFNAMHLRDAIPTGSFVNPYCFAGFPLVPYYHSHKEFIDGNLCVFSAKPYKVKDDMRIKGLKENYNIEVEPYIIAESANYVLVRYREVQQ